MKMFDTCGQYATIEKWAEKNHIAWNDYPICAKTEDGENIVVDVYGEEDGIVYEITIPQANGWNRITCYHKDGTVEDTYKKGSHR